jgi:hypothetical protein
MPAPGGFVTYPYATMKKFIIATNLGQVRVLKYRAAGEDPADLTRWPLAKMEERFCAKP